MLKMGVAENGLSKKMTLMDLMNISKDSDGNWDYFLRRFLWKFLYGVLC